MINHKWARAPHADIRSSQPLSTKSREHALGAPITNLIIMRLGKIRRSSTWRRCMDGSIQRNQDEWAVSGEASAAWAHHVMSFLLLNFYITPPNFLHRFSGQTHFLYFNLRRLAPSWTSAWNQALANMTRDPKKSESKPKNPMDPKALRRISKNSVGSAAWIQRLLGWQRGFQNDPGFVARAGKAAEKNSKSGSSSSSSLSGSSGHRKNWVEWERLIGRDGTGVSLEFYGDRKVWLRLIWMTIGMNDWVVWVCLLMDKLDTFFGIGTWLQCRRNFSAALDLPSASCIDLCVEIVIHFFMSLKLRSCVRFPGVSAYSFPCPCSKCMPDLLHGVCKFLSGDEYKIVGNLLLFVHFFKHHSTSASTSVISVSISLNIIMADTSPNTAPTTAPDKTSEPGRTPKPRISFSETRQPRSKTATFENDVSTIIYLHVNVD